MRAGLVELLSADHGIEIVGAASTGREAVQRAYRLAPDVHTIAAGHCLLSPSVTRRVIDRMATQQPTPELADQAKLDELTPRERQVLELLARGLSNREIAAALTVEDSTVRTHVKRILMKLDLRNRVQAVMFAYETGINRPADGG